MATSPQVKREPKRLLKLGRGPISLVVLTLAVAGTYFGTNLVNPEQNVGICGKTRCLAVIEASSATETGATTNTLFLNSPFDANAGDRGYATGTGYNLFGTIEIVANPTGASFDCYLGLADSSTGGTVIATNISATGTTIKFGSGHILGSAHGYGCNTTDNVTSTTLLEGAGVFVNSHILN